MIEYESKEGKVFQGERKLTMEQCAAHPKVQEIVAPRLFPSLYLSHVGKA